MVGRPEGGNPMRVSRVGTERPVCRHAGTVPPAPRKPPRAIAVPARQVIAIQRQGGMLVISPRWPLRLSSITSIPPSCDPATDWPGQRGQGLVPRSDIWRVGVQPADNPTVEF